MAHTRPRGTAGRSRHRTGRRQPIPARVVQRLIEDVEIAEEGCWVPGGYPNGAGYKRRSWSERGHDWHLFTHQIMARCVHLAGGPLPEGLVVHHVCGVRECMNPLHLRIITAEEHYRTHRGFGFSFA